MIAVLAPLTAPQMHVLGKSFEAQVSSDGTLAGGLRAEG